MKHAFSKALATTCTQILLLILMENQQDILQNLDSDKKNISTILTSS